MACVRAAAKPRRLAQAFGLAARCPKATRSHFCVAAFIRSLLWVQAFVLPFQGIVMPGMGGRG